ncbi:MAG: hypothetical protein IRZ16_07305 [Myxococcaceae bacterium]|nr:hypothetical protein [Myxococcaceae bacterium]
MNGRVRTFRAAGVVAALLWASGTFATDAGTVATAKPLSITQSVEPRTVHLGEPFTRTVTVTHARGERWELHLPAEWGDFELLGQERRRNDSGDTATTVFTLKMSAFELGQRTLPALQFEVTSAEGVRSYSSDTATVEVAPTIRDADAKNGQDLYDIRPPEPLPVPSYALIWALLAAAAVAALVYAAYRWWKRPRPAAEVPQGPPLPLDQRTRKMLDELRAERLPAQGRIKEFYSRLTDIIRGYVGERFGVEALDLTTTELITALRDVPAPGLPREDFARLLEQADLVKFARAEMTPDDCARALDFAYLLVDRTTPPPAPANGNEPPLR